ncbi:hypothetical protein QA644_34335 (plasmid) [Rhizobium sp. CC1099]|uniref:hypothetical protein n=1 Tax=Rhizobium sp. CC1099 TaxID=3039160 RepID=UPI0024B05773|nr:hypothetical protein [Rhizobium sp. CC1099]WFU91986.1 hypothetical protein QA644_34335 [Rhizobium sp. CC1099]
MRPIHIFYAWQNDRDGKVCNHFIRIALEAAVETLRQDHDVEIRLDSDTADVSGTPPVSETILRKIRECEIFVGDVTFVGMTANGKQLPNPNVMIEFGFARHEHRLRATGATAIRSCPSPSSDLPYFGRDSEQ